MKKALIIWMAVIGILLFCGTALADSWICDNCGTENTGNFCANCGAKKAGYATGSCNNPAV